MNSATKYIWQHGAPDKHWADTLCWDSQSLLVPVGTCRFLQGALLSKVQELGFEDRQRAYADILAKEAIETSAIEGQKLNLQAVRSSVATRLGLPDGGLRPTRNRHADGVVSVLLDATANHEKVLTADRLKGWQAALFPGGYSDLQKIEVGKWRTTPMQVVSGAIGRQKVHYEAPPPERLKDEMTQFIKWFNKSRGQMDGIVRAGLAHLWFLTIHPFEDGNGRIARTLSDMALAQDDGQTMRFYSLSQQIMVDRDDYYDVLEHTQKGNGEITPWLKWFSGSVQRAMNSSKEVLDLTLERARFWTKANAMDLGPRQQKAINKLFDAGPEGFEGGLTNKKYANMTGTSRQTAQRELADLVEKGLFYTEGAGRGVRYGLALWEPEKEQEPDPAGSPR